MLRPSQIRHIGSTRFWILAAFIACAFAFGGGSRSDNTALLILRPMAALLCGYALWSLRLEQVRRFRFLVWLALGIIFAVAIQLIPLPPAIWTQLPGHDIPAEVDRLAELGQVWRPISLAPAGTTNALFSLLVPLAVLLLAIQITREERYRLLPLLIGLGMVSGLLGLMQVSGPVGGPLYFYDITNASSAVGLFSNRNHAAVFLACLFPMLAIFASAGLTSKKQVNARTWASIAVGIFLLSLMLVTGSRAGLLVGLIGLAAVPLLYRPPHAPKASLRLRLAYVGVGIAAVAVVLLFVISSQDEAFARLKETSGDELRFQVWGPIFEIAGRYFPLGSGAGSFVEVFQINEPYERLAVNYLNHAHNDWLELYLTGGLLALLLMLLAVIGWAVRSFRVWRAHDKGVAPETAFARMASVVLLLLGVASLGDYPARTPSIMCLLVLMVIWLHGDAKNASEGRHERTAG